MTKTYREIPFTKNRELVSDLMTRARRFHMPVSITAEFDLSELEARLARERARGHSVGLAAYMTAATSKLLERQPRLNHHLFTDLFGRRREVCFGEISCTLVVQRKSSAGEEILLPLVLRRTNELTALQIHALIRDHKQMELESLEQFKNLERVKKLPSVALKLFSFKARSDPEFYLKYFGTYGLSSLMSQNGSPFAMSTIANTAVAFFPGTIKQRPLVVEGRILARTIMNFGFVFDHFIVDGLEMQRACEGMRELVEDPSQVLGSEPA
jgi:pyruvate/2-oxoglutarate dehydrogenase complex dihydrolipoamide acyltransferase (E2) component